MKEGLARTIENPLAGERVTFLATAEETGGEYVRIRNEASAGAQGVVMHYHLAYTESFEVSEGTLDLCVGTEDNHLVLGRASPPSCRWTPPTASGTRAPSRWSSRWRSGRRATSRRP